MLGRCVVGIETLVQDRRDVLERSHRDLDWFTKHEFGGTNGGSIGWVRYCEPIAAFERTAREDRGLSKKATGKPVEAGDCAEKLRKIEPGNIPNNRTPRRQIRPQRDRSLPTSPSEAASATWRRAFQPGRARPASMNTCREGAVETPLRKGHASNVSTLTLFTEKH